MRANIKVRGRTLFLEGVNVIPRSFIISGSYVRANCKVRGRTLFFRGE